MFLVCEIGEDEIISSVGYNSFGEAASEVESILSDYHNGDKVFVDSVMPQVINDWYYRDEIGGIQILEV